MEEIIFPNQIRIYRNVRGIGMQDLANRLGISLSAVSKIEKGYRRLDKAQLIKISDFLNCSPAELLIDEKTSPPEVIEAWKNEKERRCNINNRSGIKLMGAGLRFLRWEKGMTLYGLSNAAKLTLSVYYRIETGLREVSEKELISIARALGTSPEKIQTRIYELGNAGMLTEVSQHIQDKEKKVGSSRGSYAELIAGHMAIQAKEYSQKRLKVYGVVGSSGDIIINKEKHLSTVMCPVNVSDPDLAYAVNLCSQRLGSLLPSKSILIIDPNSNVKVGDIALLYIDSVTTKLVALREDDKGEIYGMQMNPEEKIKIKNGAILHKASSILIG